MDEGRQADLHAWLWPPYDERFPTVRDHRKEMENISHYYRFARLPVDEALTMMIGYPNIDPDDRQNDSPTQQELVEAAKKHGGTLEGYVIKSTSGRKDARVQIDGVELGMSKVQAEELQSLWRADEFDEVDGGRFRFWWD